MLLGVVVILALIGFVMVAVAMLTQPTRRYSEIHYTIAGIGSFIIIIALVILGIFMACKIFECLN